MPLGSVRRAPPPANGLPVRSGLALAYDTAGQRMLAFGGFADNGPTNDVWSWDGVRWTRLF